MLFLPTSVSSAFLALLSSQHGAGDREGFRRLFKSSLIFSLGSVIPASALLICLPESAMALFGEGFRRGWLTLVILAGSSSFVVLNNVLGQVLVSTGHVWLRSALDVCLAIVFLLLAISFVPQFEQNGLALAHLGSYMIVASMLLVAVRPRLRG